MREEKVLTDATVCFLIKDDKVLLAMKADKIGKGCWNGYGGGIDGDESPEQSIVRELKEESCVDVFAEFLEKVAIVDAHNTKSDGTKFVCRVHIYLARKWSGEPVETTEMLTPTWFEIDNLPSKMMLADKVWIPRVLAGEKVLVEAHYGPHQETLLSDVVVKQVASLSEE